MMSKSKSEEVFAYTMIMTVMVAIVMTLMMTMAMTIAMNILKFLLVQCCLHINFLT